MLSMMGEAYKVGQLQGDSLDPLHALYMATLAGARALHIDGQDLGTTVFRGGPLTPADACLAAYGLTPTAILDDAGALYIGEESGHLACLELSARLRVLRSV